MSQKQKKKTSKKKTAPESVADYISGSTTEEQDMLSGTQTEQLSQETDIEENIQTEETVPIPPKPKKKRKRKNIKVVRANAKHYKDYRKEERMNTLRNLIKNYNNDKKFIDSKKIFKKKPGKKMRKALKVNSINETAVPMMNLVMYDWIDDLAKSIVHHYSNDPKRKRTIQTEVFDSVIKKKYGIKIL